MRHLRFHIGTLVILVLVLGVSLAALREPNEIWDSGVFTLTVGVLLASLLLAIHRTEKRRAFWLGFVLFGAAYLVLSLVPPIETRLMTTKALTYLDSKMPGRIPNGVGTAYFEYNDDGLVDLFAANNSQPNTVYVSNGNGTFQDVTTTVGLNSGNQATGSRVFLNLPSGLWLVGTTENFVHIGHQLITLIVAILGGCLSRHLYAKNQAAVQASTSDGTRG
jgi:hypothetical protein